MIIPEGVENCMCRQRMGKARAFESPFLVLSRRHSSIIRAFTRNAANAQEGVGTQ
jgi:hypothetical protein